MKLINFKIFLLASVVLAGCVTGPVEEPVDLSEPQGPGLFTGDKGELNLTEVFSDEKKRKVGGATAYDVDLPGMDQKSFEEYERFKSWRRAQDPDSTEYKEFLEWQEYRQYRSYKQEQAQ